MEDVMSNFNLGSASLGLRQIMLAESSEAWRPCTNGAEIRLPDGEWLWVSPTRIAEADAEIRNGDEHPELRNY